MNRKGRLPRTIRGAMSKRRLDFVTEKNELIKDILSVGGENELGILQAELCSFGEPLDEALPSLSLPRLRRIHARVVTGELPTEIVYDM